MFSFQNGKNVRNQVNCLQCFITKRFVVVVVVVVIVIVVAAAATAAAAGDGEGSFDVFFRFLIVIYVICLSWVPSFGCKRDGVIVDGFNTLSRRRHV